MQQSNINNKKLKKLFKKNPREAIYYVRDLTGWELEECSNYVYKVCNNDENKKCNPIINAIKEIIEIIIDFLPPYY
jgi:hypothetical protein